MLPVRVEGLGPLSYPRHMRSLKASLLLSIRSGQLQLPLYSRVLESGPGTHPQSIRFREVSDAKLKWAPGISSPDAGSLGESGSLCLLEAAFWAVPGMWGQGCWAVWQWELALVSFQKPAHQKGPHWQTCLYSISISLWFLILGCSPFSTKHFSFGSFPHILTHISTHILM